MKLGLQRTEKTVRRCVRRAPSIAAQILPRPGPACRPDGARWLSARRLPTISPNEPKARSHSHLRVDGEFLKGGPWPRWLDRFKGRRWNCRSGDLVVSADNEEAELRTLLAQALDIGKGVMHLLAPLDGLKGAMLAGTPTTRIGAVKVAISPPSAPARCCGTSYPELDPRMFSYNSKHGWCTSCVGTGLALTREQRKAYDDSPARRRRQGREQSFPPRAGGRRRGRRTVPRLRRRA